MFDGILNTTLPNNFPECLRRFPRMFGNNPRNVWGHFLECLRTFLIMFSGISRNAWGHSPECLKTFSRMFGDIPQNITFSPFPVFPAFLSCSCILGFINSRSSSLIPKNCLGIFSVCFLFSFLWVFVFPSPQRWPPGPCPGPGLWLQSVFAGPSSTFVFRGPGPQFVFTGTGTQFVFACFLFYS